jgi:hypothetical protein
VNPVVDALEYVQLTPDVCAVMVITGVEPMADEKVTVAVCPAPPADAVPAR